MFDSALPVQVENEENGKHAAGPHLSWDGKVPAKPGKRLLNAARHK